MFAGKIAVGKRLLNAVLHLLGGLLQLHRAQFLHHGFRFFSGGFLALLSMDRLEHLCHQLDLGARRDREHIAVKVYGTALILGFREYFSYGLQHTETLVANHQPDPVQATATQPLEEADPAGLVLFHALGGTQNLTKTVLIHGDRYQNGHILKLSAPVAAQIDSVHIDIRVMPAL